MGPFSFFQSKRVMSPKSEKTTGVYPQLWLVHFLLWPHKAPLWWNYKPPLYKAPIVLRFLYFRAQEAD